VFQKKKKDEIHSGLLICPLDPSHVKLHSQKQKNRDTMQPNITVKYRNYINKSWGCVELPPDSLGSQLKKLIAAKASLPEVYLVLCVTDPSST
jgi:hypothetical protein